MQYTKKSLVSASLIAGSMAASSSSYVPTEPWSTLTPSGTWAGGYTDYTTTFGIAVLAITTGSLAPTTTVTTNTQATSSVYKRDVVSQIGDGQIQATTSTSSTSSKAKTTAAVISQISDGQIQATTATESACVEKTVTVTVTEACKTTAAVVSQISDGQIQATTNTSANTEATATTSTKTGTTETETTSTSTSTSTYSFGELPESCLTESSLAMTLLDSMLTDSSGRIGAIVSNYQFQFDGPPPQAGSIYAAGWSITEDGYLALGDSDVFYQCLSGSFYNLYYESIGDQCVAIHLEVVDLVDC